MPRPPPKPRADPDVKAAAVEAVLVRGATLARAAEIAGVAPRTVKNWVDAARDRAATAGHALVPRGDAQGPPAPEPIAPTDTLGAIRQQIETLTRTAQEAARVGNYTAVTQAMGHISRLTPALVKLERGREDDRDVLRVSRTEIDAAMASVRERWAALLARPLLCAHCSRKLSAAFGHAPVADPRQEDHTENADISRKV